MKIKLLKLSQALEDLNNSEEADLVRSFLNQPEAEMQSEMDYPPDKESLVFKDYSRPDLFEDYPSELEDLKTVSFKYYRDLAIQAYLDLFYTGAKLLSELGSGQFSDAFLATKGGKSIAIKFSTSPKEYSAYLQIKNKRDSLPNDLKTLLPIVYEARGISSSEAESVGKEISASEGTHFKLPSHFKYKSFIATELLSPTDTSIRDLMYEPNFLNQLIQNEKNLLPKVIKILNKWILSWDWDSNSQGGDDAEIAMIKEVLNDKDNLRIIAIDICSNIFNLKNSEENLILNDDLSVPEEILGGSFITAVINIFKEETMKNLLSFTQMRLPPSNQSNLEQVKSRLSLLIPDSSLLLKKDFINMISFYSIGFPAYPSQSIHNINMKSFLDKLNNLKNYGIKWQDVHANNLMIRLTSNSHGYGDLVVADVGLFKFTN
jgi:hypothetical protein